MKARELWPIRPTAGVGQFDAALESAPPSVTAGGSTTFSKAEASQEFAGLLGRDRVWIFLVEADPKQKQLLMQFLESHGRLLDEFPDRNEQGVASLFLYSLRRDGQERRPGIGSDMQGTGAMVGSQQ